MNIQLWNYTDAEQVLNSTAVRSGHEAYGVSKNHLQMKRIHYLANQKKTSVFIPKLPFKI